jgi:hypothetical protein
MRIFVRSSRVRSSAGYVNEARWEKLDRTLEMRGTRIDT